MQNLNLAPSAVLELGRTLVTAKVTNLEDGSIANGRTSLFGVFNIRQRDSDNRWMGSLGSILGTAEWSFSHVPWWRRDSRLDGSRTSGTSNLAHPIRKAYALSRMERISYPRVHSGVGQNRAHHATTKQSCYSQKSDPNARQSRSLRGSTSYSSCRDTHTFHVVTLIRAGSFGSAFEEFGEIWPFTSTLLL